MPGWQAAVEPFVKAGKLVAIGIMQDQHADRCRLYRQYRQLKWPLYIDAINIRDHSGVPIPVGIDESGIVRLTGRVNRDAVKAFVENDYPLYGGGGWQLRRGSLSLIGRKNNRILGRWIQIQLIQGR